MDEPATIPPKPYTRAQLENWARRHMEVLADCVLVRPTYGANGFDLDCDMTKPDYLFALSLSEVNAARRDSPMRKTLGEFISQQASEALQTANVEEARWKNAEEAPQMAGNENIEDAQKAEEKKLKSRYSRFNLIEYRQFLEAMHDDPYTFIERVGKEVKPMPVLASVAARSRKDTVDYIATLPPWVQVFAVEAERRMRATFGFKSAAANFLLQRSSLSYDRNIPMLLLRTLCAATGLGQFPIFRDNTKINPIMDEYREELLLDWPTPHHAAGITGRSRDLYFYGATLKKFTALHELCHDFDRGDRFSSLEGFRNTLPDAINPLTMLGQRLKGHLRKYAPEKHPQEAFAEISRYYILGIIANKQADTKVQLEKAFGDAFRFFRDEVVPVLQKEAAELYQQSRFAYRSSPSARPAR